MLDVRQFRNEPDVVRAGFERRHEDVAAVDEVVELDVRLRALNTERDDLRRRIRSLSDEVGQCFRDGRRDDAAVLQEESRALGEEEKALDRRSDELSDTLRDLLLGLPNLPAEDAPDGAGPEDNVEIRRGGPDVAGLADLDTMPHWDIAAEHGLLDVERAVKMSGAMFVMYRGAGAMLVRALCQLALDRNADLYEEVRPPTLVRTDTMVATGHLPKFVDDAYQSERDDLWAIPTAEVPLTSLHRDEILEADTLPRRYMAHTSCFRREAGSAGKDTRGLLRVHEFDKVELLACATAEQAPEIHAEIMRRAEGLIADLGLSYRVLDLCAGDLGNSARRTFDIEVFSPGVEQWLEVSSVSWFGDYQARRANVRYRTPGAKGTEICHTLNGSALAVPRVWAALIETNRRPDGTVAIPEILHPYLRGVTRIG